MTLEPGMTLEKFNILFVQRANKLDQFKIKQSDDFKMLLLLNKIQSRYPNWHRMIEWKVFHDKMTWKDVQEEVHRKAAAEVSDKTMTALIATGRGNSNNNRPSQQNQRSGSGNNTNKKHGDNQKGNNETPMINCSLCNKKHKADWPYYTRCGKHHTGTEKRCFVLHPELAPRSRKQSPQPPQRQEPKPLPPGQASKGVIEINTGLMAIQSETYLTTDSIIENSEASDNIFNNLKWFTTYKDLDKPLEFTSSNGSSTGCIGMGTVIYEVRTSSGEVVRMTHGNTMYSPSAPCNMVSEGILRKSGIIFDGYTDRLIHQKSNTEFTTIKWVNNVKVIPVIRVPPSKVTIPPSFAAIDLRTMHERFMHASFERVQKACKAQGIHLPMPKDTSCECCLESKSQRQISRVNITPAMRPIQVIHFDTFMCTPIGLTGFKYTLVLIDGCTSYKWTKFARSKAEISGLLCEWILEVEKQTGLNVQILHSDRGTEFAGKVGKTKEFLTANGIKWERTVPDTPEQNSLGENGVKVIVTPSRSAIIQAGLPESLWPWAEECATQLVNYLPSDHNKGGESPHSKLTRLLNLPNEVRKGHLMNLRTWGSVAYVHNKKVVKSRKMAPRAVKGYLVGYRDVKAKIYKIYVPSKHQILDARDVRFIEKKSHTKPKADDPEYLVQFVDPDPEDTDGNATMRTMSLRKKSVTFEDTPDSPNPETKDTPTTPLRNERPQLRSPPISPHQDPEEGIEGNGDNFEQTADDDGQGSSTEFEDTFEDFPDEHPLGTIEDQGQDQQQGEEIIPDEDPTPRRSARNTDRSRPDYRQLSGVRMRGQSAPAMVSIYTGHIRVGSPSTYQAMDEMTPPTMEYALSTLKVEQMLVPKMVRSMKDARKDPTVWDQWKPAFDKQYQSLVDKKVFELVDLPPGERALPCKWVTDQRFDAEGKWVRNRARLVVCGNFENGDDYSIQDLYSAVADSVSVRIFLTLMAVLDYECRAYDVITAFLNASPPKGYNVYVRQPEGYRDETRKVWRLCQALYGLRKAPLWWYETLVKVLRKNGFVPLTQDLCMFKHKDTGVLVLVYVDDILVAGKTAALCEQVRDVLRKFFELTDLGEISKFLGYVIKRDRPNHKVFLTQEHYTTKIIAKYGKQSTKQTKTPWKPDTVVPATWEPLPDADQRQYIKETGSLNYLAVNSRPDISFTVGKLCEANSKPGKVHRDILNHLWRYLNSTAHFGITLGGKFDKNDLMLRVYADAALHDDLGSRLSTGAHIVFLAGGPIYWKTKRQSMVVLSSTEAEFINLTPAGMSTIWINYMLTELGFRQPKPLVMFTDSKNAMATALNPLNAARTRHIDARYKWIIDRAAKGFFKILHIRTDEMAADGLTKPLQSEKHRSFLRQVGVTPCPWGPTGSTPSNNC